MPWRDGAAADLALRRFGRTDIFTSRIGLGCSRLGSTLSGCGGQAAIHLIHHASAAGVTLFDTADIYGQGDSERLLGAALRDRRAAVILVTKAGQRFTPLQRIASFAKRPIAGLARRVPALRRGIAAQRRHLLPRDLSSAHIRRAIEGSLGRLQTDHIDIFLLHSPSAGELAAHRSALEAFLADQTARGVIRLWGVSCDDAPALEQALGFAGLRALQLPLLLCQDRPDLVEAARLRGIGILLREVYATRDGQPATAATRQAGLTAALAIDDAVTLVGTTKVAHLDAALGACALPAALPHGTTPT